MSFILDALRKSEQERQRNKAPGIAEMRPKKNKGNRSIWLPLVALLVGLNLALLAILWLAGSDEPEAPASQTMMQSRPAPTPDYTSQPEVNTWSSADNTIAAENEPARFASISPPAPDSTAASQAGSNPEADDSVATVTEAMLDGRLSIKPLHLDLHVNSDNPSERFVFINTSRYAEGDRLSEGPTVKRINEQGVILNYQGYDYLLSRD